MKALFYLLDGDTNASTRHRVLQYFGWLAQHGIQPCASRPLPQALYRRLVEQSRGQTYEKAIFYALFFASRLRDVLRADRADVVVIQRDLFPFGPPLLERLLRTRNPRIVYDTDDATYLRPSFTPRTPFQRLRAWDKPIEVVQHARWVTAATQPIADWARRYTLNVSVVPMAIDLADYPARPVTPRPDGPVVLGWAGTAGGLRYLEALGPVLRDVAQRQPIVVRVISGGYHRLRLPGVPLEACPWRAETAIQDIATFDVGLVPLDDSPFERAKFPFKLLQYLALGIPAVAARVGVAGEVLEHGRTGLLASTSNEWRAALEHLVADAALRRQLGAAGRELVAERYTIERVGPLLLDGLRAAAR
jgi:glycosyltransferase involved in cell wall biosynthesis